MGWDAISSLRLDWSDRPKRLVIVRVEARKLFEQAAMDIKKDAGSVDCLLSIGSLDVSDCGIMLERATSESMYNENGWSARFVKKLNKEADWDFKFDKKDLWAYLSAKRFLEICAKLGLRVRFSW